MSQNSRRDVLGAGVGAGLGAGAGLSLAPLAGRGAQARERAPDGSGGGPGPGVSHALALSRAQAVSQVAYELALDVTRPDQARGLMAISFRRRPGAQDLWLDFRGPELTDLRVNGRLLAAPDWRDGHVRLPRAAFHGGVEQVSARFASPIAASGAAVIRFDDRSDGATYLYTLLVPSDANLLFPCFDQPDLKARFRWRITAPEAWSVVANAAAQDVAPAGPGARTWSFGTTEPIPTYLAAFAAGPWTQWRSAPAGQRPFTLYARRSRAKEVEVEPITAANRDAARWLAGWFGVAFPFGKLDAVLAPAFPFGGMEHVGEIFYNEESFIFREPPTLTQRLGRDATIYHEVSHQWFGDLVTMRWFDDLWLKEGFATYMAARIQAELQPQSGAWKTFFIHNKPAAYLTDSTRGTNSVWQPLENLDAAKSNYGAIVYNKAPSIIKQLAFLVGEDGFRRGLHDFLIRHAYGNATWRDLLDAVQASSGVDLRSFGEQYVLRAGLARVDTELALAGGRIVSLALVQAPATTLPGDRGGWWPMKVKVRLGYRDRPDVVLPARFEGEHAVVAGAAGLPAPDYVWSNDDDEGYGLFLLDDRSAAYVAEHVGETKEPLLRVMLWGALWDLVREVRLAPARFAELAMAALPGEGDEQIANFVLDRARTALVRYVGEADAARLFPRWEALLAGRAGEGALPYGLRKDALDTFVATARSEGAREVLHAYLSGERLFDSKPVRQVTRWNIVERLLALRDPQAAALFAAERARDHTPEAGRSAFVAGAAAPDPATKADYFRRYLDDPALNEEWVTASLSAFNAPDQAVLTRPFLRPALDRLEWVRAHRRIFFLPSWVSAFVRGQHTAGAVAEVDAYLAARPDLPPDIRRKVLEARDELDRTVRVRRAAGAPV